MLDRVVDEKDGRVATEENSICTSAIQDNSWSERKSLGMRGHDAILKSNFLAATPQAPDMWVSGIMYTRR